MYKKILASSLATLSLFSAGMSHAADDPHSISGNLGLVSDYQYRGYSQTNEGIALQGGMDYAHASGFYLGVWGSSIDWLAKGGLELDIYGGYKFEAGPAVLDVGVLQYLYPNGKTADGKDADTTEAYLGATFGPLTAKVSYSFTDLFGIPDSDGSMYYDLSAATELGQGFTLNAHFGRQKIENGLSYNDWKLGVSKEFAGLTWGVAYVDTDLDSSDDNGDARVVFSVLKTF